MNNRIFIASYKDIQVWGSRSDRLLSTLEESDEVFLLDPGDELKKPKQDLIEKMKKKSHIHIIECNGQNTGVIGKDILLKYLKKEKTTRQATLYFIGTDMNCLYNEKQEFNEYVASIKKNHNFQVKNLSKDTPVQSTNQIDLMDMIEVLGNTENNKSVSITTEEHISENKKQSQKVKDTPVRDSKTTFRNNKPHSTPQNSQIRITQEQVTVEREIFGSSFAKEEYKEEYSDLQNAKAKLILEYNNRLKRHISSDLFHKKETIVLTESQLFSFILLLISTSTADEFNESWSASEADPKIEMKEDMYKKFQAEALFYDQLCTYIYEDDIWGP